MKRILVLGAGRSSAYLIKYLQEHSEKYDWNITVGDVSEETARQKTSGHSRCRPIRFDIQDEVQRKQEVGETDIVVSLLPPNLHILVARECVRFKKPMVTASYLSDEMKKLDKDAKNSGIILLNEMGVDPGIDHMSAMKIIHSLREKKLQINSFESFTGGLIAPESDDNPWHYKITWNPRNVVLAGQGGVKFKHEGEIKYIPYHKVFSRIETVRIPKLGEFEAYANRDSLTYRDLYQLDDVPTVFRGTLRRPGYCKAWDMLVQLGATDDTFSIENSNKMTNRDFINSFLIFRSQDSVELKLCYHLGIRLDSPTLEKLHWLGLFEETPIVIKNATPAKILQHIIETKWTISPADKDMIVMLHRFFYTENNKNLTPPDSYRDLPIREGAKKLYQHLSYFSITGEAAPYTAMAKTVGLPLAISTKLILTDKIKLTGVQLPLSKEIYEPVLNELRELGIFFKEDIKEVKEKKK